MFIYVLKQEVDILARGFIYGRGIYLVYTVVARMENIPQIYLSLDMNV